MAEEKQMGQSQEPVQAQAEEIAFLKQLAKEGWNLCDNFGKAVVIERKDNDVLSLGFVGYNDNKKIVLSSSLDKWERIFIDGQALVKEMRAQAKKGKA